PARALAARRPLSGEPAATLAAPPITATLTERREQLGRFGGIDLLLLEQLEDAQPLGVAERLRILELLEQQKINAAEASELLAALGERGRDGRRRERSRWLAGERAPRSESARW